MATKVIKKQIIKVLIKIMCLKIEYNKYFLLFCNVKKKKLK